MSNSSGRAKGNRFLRESWQGWIVVWLLIVLLLTGLAWASPAQGNPQATPTPETGLSQATPTESLPPYLGQDINQMTPIILGGAILVLIILAGTLGATRRHN